MVTWRRSPRLLRRARRSHPSRPRIHASRIAAPPERRHPERSLARRMFPGRSARQANPARPFGPWHTVVGVAANVKRTALGCRRSGILCRPQSRRDGCNGDRDSQRPDGPAALARWVRATCRPSTRPAGERRNAGPACRQTRGAAPVQCLAARSFRGHGIAALGDRSLWRHLVPGGAADPGDRRADGAGRDTGGGRAAGARHAARWTLAGAVLGVAGSLFAGRLLEPMLFHVSARDPWTLAAAVAVLSAIALLAAWIPSRRAAKVDPLEALRQE